MRRKIRGTLQIQEDVKRLFMLAKPLSVTSSEFLKDLVLAHAREVKEAEEKSLKTTAVSAKDGRETPLNGESAGRVTCLGRPPGAKDLKPRKRRTKAALARSTRQELKPPTSD